MEESSDVSIKNWGVLCPTCKGEGKNSWGAICRECNGQGQVAMFDQNLNPLLQPHGKITREYKETIEPAPVEKPRIDFRGRAGPIKYARMKEFAVTFEKALDEMTSDRNAKYRKGAEMYVRLAFQVKGQELEAERPDLYRRAYEQLTGKPWRA
jgi:hypothetical protein